MPVALEVVDQLLGSRIVVVDDLAEATAVLRIHLVEHLPHQHGVLMIAREDDALAGKLTGRVSQAVLHQVAKDRAVGVLVVDDLVDLLGRKIVLRRVFALLFKLLESALWSGCRA